MLLRSLRWLHREVHSRRDPVGFARSLGVRVGEDCHFIATSAKTWGSEPYLVSIGNHVEITANVRFVTHDGAVWVYRQEHPDIDIVSPIVVDDNVFLGLGAIILLGVQIGAGSIVAAGAVVNRDIPPGSVAAGVPAKVVCTTQDYWAKHETKMLRIRSLADAEKRRILMARFGRSS